MEQHKDRGESLPVLPATAVLMATWRLIRPIACATLVACHASTSASIPCACHISVGGKQLRRSTRCVGCVRGANFFRNAHRHTRARWLSPGFFFFSFPLPPTPTNLPLSHITQPRGAAGCRRSNDMFINNLILSIFERSLHLVSRRCDSSPSHSLISAVLGSPPGL